MSASEDPYVLRFLCPAKGARRYKRRSPGTCVLRPEPGCSGLGARQLVLHLDFDTRTALSLHFDARTALSLLNKLSNVVLGFESRGQGHPAPESVLSDIRVVPDPVPTQHQDEVPLCLSAAFART